MLTIEDFWADLRTATAGGGSELPAAERLAENPGPWLRPETFDGYRSEDFEFLDAVVRDALDRDVRRFLELAEPDSADAAISHARVREAADVLARILEVLRPERFRDAESFRTQTLLERYLRGRLPPWVAGFTCRTDSDHDGEPALRIVVDIVDAAVAAGLRGPEIHPVSEALRKAYRRIDRRRFPFVSYATSQPGPSSAKASA